MIDTTQRTVGVVLAAGLVIAGCGGGGDVGAGSDPAAVIEPGSAGSSSDRLPSAAEMKTALKVVETGFSVGQGSVPGDPVLTYGAVIENASEYVVQGVTVTVDVRSVDGAGVDRRMDDPKRITRLLPGERFGFGHMLYVSTTDITDVRIELSGPDAWDRPEDVDPALLGELSVAGVSASAGALGEPVVRFTATSTFAPAATPYAYAIFRNAQGKIVGGTSQNLGQLAANQARPAVLPGAITITDLLYEAEGTMAVPGADLARTEVYLSRDLIF